MKTTVATQTEKTWPPKDNDVIIHSENDEESDEDGNSNGVGEGDGNGEGEGDGGSDC